MLFNSFVFICMTLGSLISLLSSESCATSAAHSLWACSFDLRPTLSWWYTRMLIRQAIQTPGSPRLAMLSSLVTVLSLGPPNDRTPFLAPVLRLSTRQLLMLLLRPLGYVNCLLSFMFLYARPLWYIVIISAPFTCLQTPFSISAPSILRLISTSLRSALLLVMSAFFMFPPLLSSPTFSPRGFRLLSSRSFVPVLTSGLLTL